MLRVNQIKLPVNHRANEPEDQVIKALKINKKDIKELVLRKKSIDSRKKPELYFIYSFDITLDPRLENKLLKDKKFSKYNLRKVEAPKNLIIPVKNKPSKRPVIAGTGPAGLFAAYILTESGINPLVIERGEKIEERKLTVETFWNGGELNPNSNVQFGEGGAGTFSDGKLNTANNDKEGLQQFVLDTFHRFGAPDSILIDNKPHIGTDILSEVIINMRNYLIKKGTEFRYNSTLTDIICNDKNELRAVIINDSEEIETDSLILAIGHSARDSFEMLLNHGVNMEQKPFAVGLRVEHNQSLIDNFKYGEKYAGLLPAADYKLVCKSGDRAVYSFCMCPGGYVVNASSEKGRLAINGMSYNDRNSGNSNSAIVTNVSPSDFGSDHILAGVKFQRMLEEKAFNIANGKIPVQNLNVFLGKSRASSLDLVPKIKGHYAEADLREILPSFVYTSVVEGLNYFEKIIPGFTTTASTISAIESRTSSPVRIVRDMETYESNVKGLYPTGEGAGYAGGITSAAVDGVRVGRRIGSRY